MIEYGGHPLVFEPQLSPQPIPICNTIPTFCHWFGHLIVYLPADFALSSSYAGGGADDGSLTSVLDTWSTRPARSVLSLSQ